MGLLSSPTPIRCTNGAWAHPPNVLYYAYGSAHRYFGNVFQAGVNWTNATNEDFVAWPGVPTRIDVPVIDGSFNDTWWGMGVTVRTPGTTTIVRSAVYLNQPRMDKLKDFMRTKVATHEFGHILGLQHPEACGEGWSTASVMHQGVLSYNTPQMYDIELVNRLYS